MSPRIGGSVAGLPEAPAREALARESSEPSELGRDQSALCFHEAEMTRDTIQTIPR